MGRPRDEEARNAILRASLSLVKEFGYRSLTIEKIAQRAGTGKTTIYRWWPSKAAVVVRDGNAPMVAIGCTIECSQEANGIPGLYTKLPRGGNCDVLCKPSEL